ANDEAPVLLQASDFELRPAHDEVTAFRRAHAEGLERLAGEQEVLGQHLIAPGESQLESRGASAFAAGRTRPRRRPRRLRGRPRGLGRLRRLGRLRLAIVAALLALFAGLFALLASLLAGFLALFGFLDRLLGLDGLLGGPGLVLLGGLLGARRRRADDGVRLGAGSRSLVLLGFRLATG